MVPPDSASLVAIEFVIVTLKFASSPNAAASSLRVSNVVGAVSTKFAIAVFTNDSVANVLFDPPPVGVTRSSPEDSVRVMPPSIILFPLRYKSLNL